MEIETSNIISFKRTTSKSHQFIITEKNDTKINLKSIIQASITTLQSQYRHIKKYEDIFFSKMKNKQIYSILNLSQVEVNFKFNNSEILRHLFRFQ